MTPHRTEAEWLQILDTIDRGFVPVGGRRSIYASGLAQADKLRSHGLCLDGQTILDIGCGSGRLPLGLLRYEPCVYIGLDAAKPNVDFCRRAFAPWPFFMFHHLNVRSHYNGLSAVPREDAEFHIADASIDCAVACSLFTHLGTTEAATRYLDETWRCLKPGGLFWTTWFRCPPWPRSDTERKTVYMEHFIRGVLESWEWIHDEDGTRAVDDAQCQWKVLVRKPCSA